MAARTGFPPQEGVCLRVCVCLSVCVGGGGIMQTNHGPLSFAPWKKCWLDFSGGNDARFRLHKSEAVFIPNPRDHA